MFYILSISDLMYRQFCLNNSENPNVQTLIPSLRSRPYKTDLIFDFDASFSLLHSRHYFHHAILLPKNSAVFYSFVDINFGNGVLAECIVDHLQWRCSSGKMFGDYGFGKNSNSMFCNISKVFLPNRLRFKEGQRFQMMIFQALAYRIHLMTKSSLSGNLKRNVTIKKPEHRMRITQQMSHIG